MQRRDVYWASLIVVGLLGVRPAYAQQFDMESRPPAPRAPLGPSVPTAKFPNNWQQPTAMDGGVQTNTIAEPTTGWMKPQGVFPQGTQIITSFPDHLIVPPSNDQSADGIVPDHSVIIINQANVGLPISYFDAESWQVRQLPVGQTLTLTCTGCEQQISVSYNDGVEQQVFDLDFGTRYTLLFHTTSRRWVLARSQ